jgi:hypothetical protein
VTSRSIPIVALAALTLAACEGPSVSEAAKAQPAADQAYAAPPQVLVVRRSGGAIEIEGAAPAKARVRLAQPNGAAMFAAADGEGRWRLSFPAPMEPQVFGISAATSGRTAQAQGYLLVSPDGRAALLRAGGAALRVDALPATAIGAIDFDKEGGAVVSGRAPPRTTFDIRVNGRQATEASSDEQGRFEVVLGSPLTPGHRRLQMIGPGFEASVDVSISPPIVPPAGPLRAAQAGGALRIDWVTPGGGLQTTMLPANGLPG